jgi:hypothetical protein
MFQSYFDFGLYILRLKYFGIKIQNLFHLFTNLFIHTPAGIMMLLHKKL